MIMKMYVANCSTQTHEFCYRLPNVAQLRRVSIQPMAQEKLPDAVDQAAIDYIVAKAERYGFVNVVDLRTGKTKRPLTRLCYSIDAPVSSFMIEALAINNRGALVEMGSRIQEEAAIVSSKKITDDIDRMNREGDGKSADPSDLLITVQEEFDSKDERPQEDIFSKGYKVSGTPEKPNHPLHTTRGKGRKK
jgi:hypothetical protein